MNTSSYEFSVVFVCTGNRFRSPLGEHLLRAATTGLPVRVSSAGTLELPGGPALPEAIELGRELDVDLSTHCSRTLSRELLEDADVVLGFERRHVARAVVDGGVDRDRVFTLGELTALLRASDRRSGADPVTSARSAVAEASRLRTRLGNPKAVELADPFGGSSDGYRRTAAGVRELVDELAGRLFGVSARAARETG